MCKKMEAAKILTKHVGRNISYVHNSEEDARKAFLDMGMSDWHTNILLELLMLSREGYLSNLSHDVEVVTGNKPISFAQFAKEHADAF